MQSRGQLLMWLDHNHSRKEGIWLITFKKVEGAKYISTDEALDSLVAYGWTDRIRRKLDDTKTVKELVPLRYTRMHQDAWPIFAKCSHSPLPKNKPDIWSRLGDVNPEPTHYEYHTTPFEVA